jgi:inner membrane protein
VDSFTHALTAAIPVYVLGVPELIPFAVAGAVVIDADVFFSRFFDDRPGRYLLTHGGITHSIAGAAVMAVPAWAVATLVAPAAGFPAAAVPIGFATALAGAYLHLGLDWLACPGIPLLAPRSDRKYTLGLLPGPSLLLFSVSIAFLVWLALGTSDLPGMLVAYGAFIAAFLAVRLAAFGLVRVRVRGGRLIPRVSPLRWLVIGETPGAWTVGEYRFRTGMTAPTVYPKYRDTTPGEAAAYLETPEARRVRYHSYITTVMREGDTLVVADPLRESGAVFYPPHFKRAFIPLRNDLRPAPADGGGDGP